MAELVFCSRCNGIRNECGCNHRSEVRESHKTAARGYDWKWTKLSKSFRTEHPMCQVCLRNNRITPAVEVHHLESIASAPHLRLEWNNLLAVCKPCHLEVEGRGHDFHDVGRSTKPRPHQTSNRPTT